MKTPGELTTDELLERFAWSIGSVQYDIEREMADELRKRLDGNAARGIALLKELNDQQAQTIRAQREELIAMKRAIMDGEGAEPES